MKGKPEREALRDMPRPCDGDGEGDRAVGLPNAEGGRIKLSKPQLELDRFERWWRCEGVLPLPPKPLLVPGREGPALVPRPELSASACSLLPPPAPPGPCSLAYCRAAYPLSVDGAGKRRSSLSGGKVNHTDTNKAKARATAG